MALIYLELADAVGTIEWQSSLDNITFSPLSDTAPLPYYMVTDLVQTTYYKAVVTSEGCPSATSNVQTITVNPSPTAGSVIGDGPVCSGTNSKTLTLEGSTGNIQWQSSTTSASTGFTNIASATSSTYTATNLSVKTAATLPVTPKSMFIKPSI